MRIIELHLIALATYSTAYPLLDQTDINNRFDYLCESCSHDHGRCLLDHCICFPGWSGPDCQTKWNDSVPQCSNFSVEVSYNPTVLFCNNTDATDKCFFHPDFGVVRVSKQRWLQAQRAELALWESLPNLDNDRTAHHSEQFLQYQDLDSKHLGHVLEIASGPFTQLSFLLDHRNISFDSITLLDPMIMEYVKLPNCAYSTGSLRNRPVSFITAGGEMIRGGESYDTVIMINGIEHCQDAIQVLHNVYFSLKPGGVLILSESFYDTYEAKPYLLHESILDFIFHPIRLRKSLFDKYLNHFERIMYRETDQNEIYFIGRKPIHDKGWLQLLRRVKKQIVEEISSCLL